MILTDIHGKSPALSCRDAIPTSNSFKTSNGDGYRVIRSRKRRKTISLEVKDDGQVVVHAPERMPDDLIRQFVYEKRDWIAKTRIKIADRQKTEELEKTQERKSDGEAAYLTPEELQQLYREAARVIPGRVAYYAPKVGVTYGRITIRCQKSRWGSCSAKGNLNFNCLLMLAPMNVIDSVVVHELCHRKEMNHSKRFWQEVRRVYPDYDAAHGWLKEHGESLLIRAKLR